MDLLKRFFPETAARLDRRRQRSKSEIAARYYHSDKLFSEVSKEVLVAKGFDIQVVTGVHSLLEYYQSGQVQFEDRAFVRKTSEPWINFYQAFHQPEYTKLEVALASANPRGPISSEVLNELRAQSIGEFCDLPLGGRTILEAARVLEVAVGAKNNNGIDVIPKGSVYIAESLRNAQGAVRNLGIANNGESLVVVRVDQSNLGALTSEYEPITLSCVVPVMPGKNWDEEG